jgi:hypothetical protein
MKLKRDLGMQLPTITSSRKYHYSIYECPVCHQDFKTQCRFVLKINSCKSCAAILRNTKHGESKTRLYNIWCNMKNRCAPSITKHKSHQRYIDNNITVCAAWENSYQNFAHWATNNGYAEKLTIDRIDTLKGYCPSNCRWATYALQAHNTITRRVTNTTGYKGVHRNKNRKKFGVQIRVNGKRIWLGTFDSALEGAKIYDKYVIDNKLAHTINNV